ncbi:MAG: SBBP repeat-containing protein [Bacteroidetes bacterium]|nr:SBBP repeat-containing protein [Bacteroidota bacterium]
MIKARSSLFFLLISLSAVISAQQLNWAKAFSGTMDEEPRAIATDKWGNIYTTGLFYGTVDFDPNLSSLANKASQGGTDIFISKLDSVGNFKWIKSIGGSDYEMGSALAVDTLGNIYVTGYFSGTVDFNPNAGTASLSSVSGSNDIFVLKLDSAGNFGWVKHLAGTSSEYGTAIALDKSMNILVAGHFTGTVDFDPSTSNKNISAVNKDAFVCKLDNMGNFSWAISLTGSNDEEATSIATTSVNEVIVAGGFKGTVDFDPSTSSNYITASGGSDAFVCKLSPTGSTVWVKTISGSGDERINGIAIDKDENIYSTGYFNGGAADFDSGLGSANLVSSGNDAFVCKMGYVGNYIWAKQVAGGGNSIAWAIAVDDNAGVFTTGYFENTNDFDPGSGSHTLSSTAFSFDGYVQKLDSAGNFTWVAPVTGSGDQMGLAIAVSYDRKIYSTGYFFQTANFNPSGSPVAITAKAFADVYVYKISENPLGVYNTNKSQHPFIVYPNPASTVLQVNWEVEQQTIRKYTLTDVTGKIVLNNEVVSATRIDVSSLSSGLYFLYLNDYTTPIKFYKE